MRILYVTTVGGTMTFFKSFISELIKDGHTVDIATCENNVSVVPDCYREWGCKIHQISTSRSPFSWGNLKAIKQIKNIVRENGYELVHCHTPIAAACTRVACRSLRKKGVKVYYTAHGLHFHKGAPLKNWLIFYPIEKILAHFTDVLIAINSEDYARAQKKFKAKRVEYVPGVGIDVAKFANAAVDRDLKRDELGIPREAFMLLSVGELNDNKNHETVILALAEINDATIHYAIAGKGAKKEYLEALAKDKGVNLHMLGYRRDIPELDKTADVFVHPSYREGLNVSIMEALASGLPVVCGNIRGNVDLVNESRGVLFTPGSVAECAAAIKKAQCLDLAMLRKNNAFEAQKYEVTVINARMREFYGL